MEQIRAAAAASADRQKVRAKQVRRKKSCAKRTQIDINMYKNALCNAESIKNALHLMAHFCVCCTKIDQKLEE